MPADKLFAAYQEAKKEVKGGGGAVFPISGDPFAPKDAKAKNIPYMAGSTSHDMAPPMLQGMAKSFMSARETASYTWYFDRMLPGDNCGAWHSSDLWYWFGTLPNCWRPMTEKDYELSEQMTDYLCNFCKTGNPNNTGALPQWVASDKHQKKALRLGEDQPHMGKASMAGLVWTLLTNKAVGE